MTSPHFRCASCGAVQPLAALVMSRTDRGGCRKRAEATVFPQPSSTTPKEQ